MIPVSSQYTTAILAADDLSALERLLGLVLSMRASPEGHVVMSLTELAREAGVHRTTVKRLLPQMAEKSWVRISAPTAADARRGARNRYTLVIPTARERAA